MCFVILRQVLFDSWTRATKLERLQQRYASLLTRDTLATHLMFRARISHLMSVDSVGKAVILPLLSGVYNWLCPLGKQQKSEPRLFLDIFSLQQFLRFHYLSEHQNDDYTLVGHCPRSCYNPPFGDGGRRHRHIPQHRNPSFKRLHVRSFRRILLNRTNVRSKFIARRNRRGQSTPAATLYA